MARANLKHLVEDAEMRVQRGQRRLDRQRESVAALERADRDAKMAKRVLKILEKALAVHVADRDRLAKRLARPPR
jgi:predicted RNase H-like nuclease (RuvC/YqgF family)